MYVYMNARVNADRENSGKKMIVGHDRSIRLRTLVPRAETSTRSYESLVFNRSDVMQESINRNLFFPSPFSRDLSFPPSFPFFLPPSFALSAVSLRAERICRFSFISRFIHLPEKQPRSDAPLRALPLERGSHPLSIFYRYGTCQLF